MIFSSYNLRVLECKVQTVEIRNESIHNKLNPTFSRMTDTRAINDSPSDMYFYFTIFLPKRSRS